MKVERFLPKPPKTQEENRRFLNVLFDISTDVPAVLTAAKIREVLEALKRAQQAKDN